MSEEKHSPHIIYHLIGTGLFTGYSPFAPGTVGSIFCIAILSLAPSLHPLLLSAIAAGIFIIGVISAGALEKVWGRDPGKINIDEIAGMTIALIALPKSWIWFPAFILFRAFDIFKPPPIRSLEYLPGGWGIMLDDVLAGIYANICCQILVQVL